MKLLVFHDFTSIFEHLLLLLCNKSAYFTTRISRITPYIPNILLLNIQSLLILHLNFIYHLRYIYIISPHIIIKGGTLYLLGQYPLPFLWVEYFCLIFLLRTRLYLATYWNYIIILNVFKGVFLRRIQLFLVFFYMCSLLNFIHGLKGSIWRQSFLMSRFLGFTFLFFYSYFSIILWFVHTFISICHQCCWNLLLLSWNLLLTTVSFNIPILRSSSKYTLTIITISWTNISFLFRFTFSFFRGVIFL